eukprot:6646696-Pyramimonas_sp.AAC.1
MRPDPRAASRIPVFGSVLRSFGSTACGNAELLCTGHSPLGKNAEAEADTSLREQIDQAQQEAADAVRFMFHVLYPPGP